MARKVFFSFHYEKDSVRAGQVRNSNIIKTNSISTSDFIDAAKWEEVRRNGDTAIQRWIQQQLTGTSVTVVLIGAETSQRKWVEYEIKESYKKGNGLLGVYIHRCPIFDGSTDRKGDNPFEKLSFISNGEKLSDVYKTYDWIEHDGRNNLGNWIERAAQQAGR